LKRKAVDALIRAVLFGWRLCYDLKANTDGHGVDIGLFMLDLVLGLMGSGFGLVLVCSYHFYIPDS
jgi:hypothetical protein